jgi:hypothetical protein
MQINNQIASRRWRSRSAQIPTTSRAARDDQVLFLMGKTVRLADYLRIGLEAVERNAKAEEQKIITPPDNK